MAKPKKSTPPPRKGGQTAPPAPSALIPKGPDTASRRRLFGIGMLILAFLVYANTLGNGYAQDDAIVITDNMFTEQGVKGIPGILKYDTFYGFFKESGKARLVSGGRYRPLSLVTFALEVELFGQSPFIGHLVNILLFALCCWLFYETILLWFPGNRPGALWVALGAAALFAAHPIHSEAVANIKGRDEILAMLGSLGAMYFAFRAVQEKKAHWHYVGGVCLFLGLMAKENAIMYLFLIPLALYYFAKIKGRQMLVLMVPYAAASGIFLFIRGQILGWSLGAPPMELLNNPYLKIVGNAYVPFSFAEKLATVLYSLGRYLQLLLVPHPLTHDYYPRHIDLMSWSHPGVWISLLGYLALLGFALWGMRQKTPLSFAAWLYLIPLAIVSNLVFPVGVHMAERLIFMPSAGFALAAGLLLFPTSGHQQPPWRLAILGVLVLAGSIRTIARNPVWKDNYTLFSTDIRVSVNSAKLQNGMAGELVTQAQLVQDSIRKTDMLRRAIGHAAKAYELHPPYTNAYLIQGNAHYYLKEYDQAIAAYRKALDYNPNYREVQKNLPIVLRDAGRYAGEVEGNLGKAITYLAEADRLQPGDYETLRLLGVAHGVGQQHAQAIAYFTRATELQPGLADAWRNLSTAYFASGDAVNGQKFLAKAQELE